MSAFSTKHVDEAVLRLPIYATDHILMLLQRAREQGIARLADACEAELKLRPIPFTKEMAARSDDMAKAVTSMSLVQVIRHAFSDAEPVRDYEQRLIRCIAAKPSITYRELEVAYGKGDAGLVIGHLVYDRFGCFRHLLHEAQLMSDLLVHREKSTEGVRYYLKPEAEMAFRELGII